MTQFANHEPGCDGSVTVPDTGFGGQDMTYECEHPSHQAAVIFSCPFCSLELTGSALVRPVRVRGGLVCPGCYETVPS